jgi:bisphosphoglycerate-dependent phosphoglycerate mutase
MEKEHIRGDEIKGNLDIFVAQNEDEYNGEVLKWNEVLIHGDPEGLRSLAKLLIQIADLDQEKIADKNLPIGAREHYHLRPKFELANSSDTVIVGRLDAKGTGDFYDRFVAKDNSK